MSDKIKFFPQIFYARHMETGIAEYDTEEGKTQRIFLSFETLKKMNASFEGKPVFIGHRTFIDDEIIKNESVGYVVRSFYNISDNSFWVEMLITRQEGYDAITKQNLKVSNAYIILDKKEEKNTWHNVEYDIEILEAQYDHLALVENPRYENSFILTKKEFLDYNNKKVEELKKVANSKGGDKKMKEKIKEIANSLLALLKNEDEKKEEIKQEVQEKINEEVKEEKEEKDFVIKIVKDGKEYSLDEILKNCTMFKSKNEAEEEIKKDEAEEKKEIEIKKDETEEKKEIEIKKDEAEEKKEEIKKENSLTEKEEKEFVENILNADKIKIEEKIETSLEKLERGKKRYGTKIK